jgi:hypothetical protein
VANDLTLVDTVAMNVSHNDQTDAVHDGTITLFAENGFPFDAKLQIYLLNSSNVAVDSLLGYASTIVEAPINSSLRVTGKKLTKISIPVPESRMNLLFDTKKAAIKVKFNTSAQPNYIKIYSDYSIGLKVVGDFNYTIHLQ